MTVDQGMRAEVYASLREAHGEKVATAMMEMLPPAGVPDLATKADVGVLRAELAAVEARMGERVEALRAEMHEGFAIQTRQFVGWMLGGMAFVSTVAGGIAGVVVRLG